MTCFHYEDCTPNEEFLRASWFQPKHTIESIQGQPLEHHLISIIIINHNEDLLIWLEVIAMVNIIQESSVSIPILGGTM